MASVIRSESSPFLLTSALVSLLIAAVNLIESLRRGRSSVVSVFFCDFAAGFTIRFSSSKSFAFNSLGYQSPFTLLLYYGVRLHSVCDGAVRLLKSDIFVHPDIEPVTDSNFDRRLNNQVPASDFHPKLPELLTECLSCNLRRSTCFSLFDLHQARLSLDAAHREFLRRATPWSHVRQPRNRTNSQRQKDPPFGSQPL